ncbi:MAG: hypothetical protein R2865_16000, partial [Deinococcales bacterium]
MGSSSFPTGVAASASSKLVLEEDVMARLLRSVLGAAILLWLSVFAQAQTQIPSLSLAMGTQIQIVLPDLVSIVGTATVQNGQLSLQNPLPPGREVRLLITHTGTGELAMPTAYVSPDGRDLLVNIPNSGLV